MFDPKTKKEIKQVVEFAAGEVITTILTHEGEERVDNQQNLYNMACDALGEYDLTQMVLTKLRQMLKVK